MILSAAASMSPGRLACQVHSITPQEPPTFGEFFRVDQTTGAPTRLEPVQVKSRRQTKRMDEVFAAQAAGVRSAML